MRKAFIAFGIAVFAAYCWASVVYQNRVDVPGYRLVEVDLLGGASRAAWDASQQVQFQRLMELEAKNYQLPEGAAAEEGGEVPVGRPLTSDDFARFIAEAPPGRGVIMKLRDPGAIYALLGHHYLLRDSIPNPDDPDGLPLYFGGHPLDKDMLDRLRGLGVGTITVTGHAAPVNFQLGTSLMIAVIFMTLVAALKPVVWEPFMAMLEKRRHELEIGGEAERQNQLEATRFQEEERRRRGALNQEIQELRLKGQRRTAIEAGEIIKASRDREKEIKLVGLRDIAESTRYAEDNLEGRIPDLAEAVADALTPTRGGTRWGVMARGTEISPRQDDD